MKKFRLSELKEDIAVKQYRQELFLGWMQVAMSAFYGIINYSRGTPVDLSLPLDCYVPLVPVSIIIYNVWYPLLWLIVYIKKYNPREMMRYQSKLAVGMCLCCITYILMPSIVSIRPTELPDDIFSFFLKITYTVDNPYNGLPSSHVVLATVCAITAMGEKKYRWVCIMMMLVTISTMTTKQHIFADVLLGFIYGLVVNKLIDKLLPPENLI